MKKIIQQMPSSHIPQPIRGDKGATDDGPDLQNPDMLVPPATDAGIIENLKFSFSDTHMRLEHGGRSREVTVRELPAATQLAAVNMRLKQGGVRELHWHKEAEWGYVLTARSVLLPWTKRDEISLMMSEKAISGTFRQVFPTRFKGWRKAVNFCLFLMTVHSPKTALFLDGLVCPYTPERVGC